MTANIEGGKFGVGGQGGDEGIGGAGGTGAASVGIPPFDCKAKPNGRRGIFGFSGNNGINGNNGQRGKQIITTRDNSDLFN
ncbi:hypothetical protein D3C87_1353870 [compost metagenome]